MNSHHAACWFPDSNRKMDQFLLWGKQYSQQDGLKPISGLRGKCAIKEGITMLGRLDFYNKEMIVTE